jgi:hypothetical protein
LFKRLVMHTDKLQEKFKIYQLRKLYTFNESNMFRNHKNRYPMLLKKSRKYIVNARYWYYLIVLLCRYL